MQRFNVDKEDMAISLISSGVEKVQPLPVHSCLQSV